ncbi:unnamed protein product [Victoria cruziana]
MAEQQQYHGVMEKIQEKSPSASQVVAVLALFPVGGTLLTLSGVTLTGTLIGLALLTPLFLLFSPVLVPAAILIVLSIAGFLTSGAFGLTAISSFSWLYKQVSGKGGSVVEQIEHAKRRAQEAAGQAAHRAQETAGHIGQRAREAGQAAQQRAGGGRE